MRIKSWSCCRREPEGFRSQKNKQMIQSPQHLSQPVFPLLRQRNAMTKSKLGKNGFTWLTLPHHSLSLKEVRTGTQNRKASGSRSCAASQLAPPVFRQSPGPAVHGWPHPQQSRLSPHLGNTLPSGLTERGIFSIEAPSFQIQLACVRLA